MIDYMAVGLVLFFAVMGALSGVLLQGLRVVAAAISIWVSLTYSPVIADSVELFARSQMLREYGLPILLFAILYMIMALIAKLLVGLGKDVKSGPSGLSRLFGAVFGVVLGLMLAYFIVSVGLTAQDSSGRRMVALTSENSKFVGFVADHRIDNLSGSETRHRLNVRIRDAAEGVRDTAGNAAEGVRDTAGNAVEGVRDTAGTAAETVRDTAGNAAETVRDTAGNAVERVNNSVDK